MLFAQQEKSVHSGQYGGLLGQECTQITILEEFHLNVSLLTRTPLGNFESDLQ